jgi:hypothetical protein
MVRITVGGRPAIASQEQINFIAREFTAHGGVARRAANGDQVISLNEVQFARAIQRFNDQVTAATTSALMSQANRLAETAERYLIQRSYEKTERAAPEARSQSASTPKSTDFDVSGLSEENLRAADSLRWLDGEF